MKHPSGCHVIAGRTYFTLYAPYAQKLRLLLFENCSDDHTMQILPMRAIGGGFWEYSDIRSFEGFYYAYQVNEDPKLIPDPYARSVSHINDYHQSAKAYIYQEKFDWGKDSFVSPVDPRDLIIYEAHIKDMTADVSSEVQDAGTYLGMIEKIPYLKELGINAVELLPIQLFANYEPPYGIKTEYVENSWNPYAYNHWGYMTSYFFAPANIYSVNGTREYGKWSDPKGKEIDEFKALVKALHKEGISVIMDVVYNHISQYNDNPLRSLAEDHYIDPHGNASGCGNDIKSESPLVRALISDSIRYWMEEFHIDGFRFDLAGLLDDDTLNEIRSTARSVNPNAILLGEPWGKRYFPQRMSDLGYGVWNDVFRNGVKGENPFDRKGFIFGQWDNNLHKDNFIKLLTGSHRIDGGLVASSRYTVNYIASHDGYTLGDFVRIALNKKEKIVKLNNEELQLHKMAAFILMMSQGISMIHSGQEFARTKIIVKEENIEDKHVGEWDPDSYDKDNRTNYLNYDHLKENADLFDFYSDLISVRKFFPELRSAERKKITILHATGTDLAMGYLSRSAERTCAILINSSINQEASFSLDEGEWDIYVNVDEASTSSLGSFNAKEIKVLPRSFYLLVKKV